MSSTTPRVLCVCLGNICRSPLAEGLIRRAADAEGFEIKVDSAGTSAWHAGDLPDPRARQVGEERGCRMEMRARQISSRDFASFDLILAMDYTNLRELLAHEAADPTVITLLRSFDPDANDEEVPDPYYGDLEAFEQVADMITSAVPGILETVRHIQAKS